MNTESIAPQSRNRHTNSAG